MARLFARPLERLATGTISILMTVFRGGSCRCGRSNLSDSTPAAESQSMIHLNARAARHSSQGA